MKTGQLIPGIILVVLGTALILIAVFFGLREGSFVALIYGIPSLILGIFILLNKNEDRIEKILKGGKK
jgi:thiamine transporter ThiT